MVVLGIDPGYAIVGYGAIQYKNGSYIPLGFGAILTQAEEPFNERLERIFRRTDEIIKSCKPDVMSIEKLYFQNNQKTAICVAEARGVILLAAQLNKVPVFEYTPLQVKQAVTGYGQAKKPQVMEMTRRLLNLKEMPKLDDTADALAVAICHTHAAGSSLRQFMMKKGIN